jgi:hypothetical protein
MPKYEIKRLFRKYETMTPVFDGDEKYFITKIETQAHPTESGIVKHYIITFEQITGRDLKC